MKGYEFVKFAVVAIGVVLLALLASVGSLTEASFVHEGQISLHQHNSHSDDKSNYIHNHHKNSHYHHRKRKQKKMVCRPTSSKDSFWIRNDCHEGFLAIISDRRVVTVNTAINEQDPLVEFVRESCEDPSARLWDPVKTRLYSPSQHRYICFNKRGHLKSVRRRKADRMGDLCAFYERPITSEHHQKYNSEKSPNLYFALQSAAHPGWYMGFGPHTPRARKFIGLRYSAIGQEISLPRRMGRWGHRRKNQKSTKNRPVNPRKSLVRPLGKCDFRFYMGIFDKSVEEITPSTPIEVNPSPTWDGLFQKFEAEAAASNAKDLRRHRQSEPQNELESNYPVRKTSSNGAKKYHGISSFHRP